MEKDYQESLNKLDYIYMKKITNLDYCDQIENYLNYTFGTFYDPQTNDVLLYTNCVDYSKYNPMDSPMFIYIYLNQFHKKVEDQWLEEWDKLDYWKGNNCKENSARRTNC